MRYLKKYFQDIGVQEDRSSSFLLQDIRQKLEMNAMTSEELMLTYLKCLALDGLVSIFMIYVEYNINSGIYVTATQCDTMTQRPVTVSVQH